MTIGAAGFQPRFSLLSAGWQLHIAPDEEGERGGVRKDRASV